MFKNRNEAGKLLAAKLADFQNLKNLLILAIPRGGVVIGGELATILGCSLNVIVTKKIGAPQNQELAIGAVGTTGQPVVDEELAAKLEVGQQYLKAQILKLKTEVEREERLFKKEGSPLNLKGKTVILTDDGVVTGATIKSAIEIIRQQNPKMLVVAVPVISKESLTKISALVDRLIYLEVPEMFFALSQFYQEFPQVSDEEVIQILKEK